MTAKSGMECNRLLFLGGKGRLIVIRYACLWQNAPVQVLVNLFVPTYTTAPLRTNRKYVYKGWKLHVHKIKRNAQYSDLYAILYQRLTNAFLKGALLLVYSLLITCLLVMFNDSICYFETYRLINAIIQVISLSSSGIMRIPLEGVIGYFTAMTFAST